MLASEYVIPAVKYNEFSFWFIADNVNAGISIDSEVCVINPTNACQTWNDVCPGKQTVVQKVLLVSASHRQCNYILQQLRYLCTRTLFCLRHIAGESLWKSLGTSRISQWTKKRAVPWLGTCICKRTVWPQARHGKHTSCSNVKKWAVGFKQSKGQHSTWLPARRMPFIAWLWTTDDE